MEKLERLWERYWKIADQHGNGFATPILWYLALRGAYWRDVNLRSKLGYQSRIAEAFGQAGLAYRAFRRGDPIDRTISR